MEQSIYDLVGGEPTFKRLVDIFYAKVEADPLLRPMFPDDMEPGKLHQTLFLMQLFGGITTYSEQRGHPRLKMRHMPFVIGREESDHWLAHMLAAIDEVGITDPARAQMHEYFERAAKHMINVEYP